MHLCEGGLLLKRLLDGGRSVMAAARLSCLHPDEWLMSYAELSYPPSLSTERCSRFFDRQSSDVDMHHWRTDFARGIHLPILVNSSQYLLQLGASQRQLLLPQQQERGKDKDVSKHGLPAWESRYRAPLLNLAGKEERFRVSIDIIEGLERLKGLSGTEVMCLPVVMQGY